MSTYAVDVLGTMAVLGGTVEFVIDLVSVVKVDSVCMLVGGLVCVDEAAGVEVDVLDGTGLVCDAINPSFS